MTRNAGAELTRTMWDQFESLRRREHVGIRLVKGRRVVTSSDLRAKEHELLALLGEVRAWYTAIERQRLYKNNKHLGVTVARLVLTMAGHPWDRCGGGFTVD